MQNKSTHVELRHNELVEKLKNKSCRVIFEQQDKDHLKGDYMKIEINDEYELDTKIGYYDECDFDSVSEEGKFYYIVCLISKCIVIIFENKK